MLQQSVEELYANHHGWLRGWLHRKLGNSGDAADLAHDTFLRVLRKAVKPSEAMPAFVPETIREPRAYLTTIANGLVVSHIRRRSLEQAWLETLASLPQPQFISPEQRAVVWQTLLDVDAALATLAPRVRQALQFAGRFDDTSIWATSQRRRVTLQGCVSSAQQAVDAENLVRNIDDVEDVLNQLMVGTSGKPPYRTDSDAAPR